MKIKSDDKQVYLKSGEGVGPDHETWTTIILPSYPWYHLDLAELWRYRDLILIFVRRDFIAQYKQTILGPVWFFIQPLFTTIIFTLVFGRIAKISTDGMPDFLFYLSGTVCWGYFAASLQEISNTFIANAQIFGKVYFPRLVIPISIVISNSFKFLIQFVLFLGFLLYYYFHGANLIFSWWCLTLPFIILQMALLGIACGILISSLTTKYRDLSLVVTFGVQLWMFVTPVVYPLSQIPLKYRYYFAANPMAPVLETFRSIFLGTKSMNQEYLILGWLSTLTLLFLGLILFRRVEKNFMDTI